MITKGGSERDSISAMFQRWQVSSTKLPSGVRSTYSLGKKTRMIKVRLCLV